MRSGESMNIGLSLLYPLPVSLASHLAQRFQKDFFDHSTDKQGLHKSKKRGILQEIEIKERLPGVF